MRGSRMLAESWVLLFSALAACGGRVMFDSDQVKVDPSAPIGDGASGSGPGISTDAACSNYCSAQARQVCSFEVDDQCSWFCSQELGRRTLDCQKNATRMIDCLVAAYQSSQDCSTAEQRAREQCATWITIYQGCAVGQPNPPPAPTVTPAPTATVMPTPTPTPTPTPPKSGCSGSGSGDAFSCSVNMKCGDRSYDSIHCKQNPDGSSSCSCGSNFFMLNERVITACNSGIWNCAR